MNVSLYSLRHHQNHLLLCYRGFGFQLKIHCRWGWETSCHSRQVFIFYQHQRHPESTLWRIFLLYWPHPLPLVFNVLGRESGWHACKPQWPTANCITRAPHSVAVWCHRLACPVSKGQASAIGSLTFLQKISHQKPLILRLNCPASSSWHTVGICLMFFFLYAFLSG